MNDHLGDALWRVGREREARFQWDQALSLKPEPEDAAKIKLKLEKGSTPSKRRRRRPPAIRRSNRARSVAVVRLLRVTWLRVIWAPAGWLFGMAGGVMPAMNPLAATSE